LFKFGIDVVRCSLSIVTKVRRWSRIMIKVIHMNILFDFVSFSWNLVNSAIDLARCSCVILSKI
jgi:hypothetical protein